MTDTALDNAKERFGQLLDLFPITCPADSLYVEQARTRGWSTFQHLPRAEGAAKLLDVGSMKGLFGPAYMDLWGYSEVRLLGNDLPPEGFIERKTADGRLFRFPVASCNIETMRWPYQDETFDTVVCTEVLEHLVFDPAFAMNEMARVLKPGGHALITVPNAVSDECLTYLANNMQPGFLRNYIADALKSGRRDLDTVYGLGHFHEYTGPELESLANSTGFDILTITGHQQKAPLLQSWRFRLLALFVRVLFPRSKRIRESHILALLRKNRYTPLENLPTRYPQPLYQPLVH